MELFIFFLILFVPGLIGAIAYSVAESFKSKCNICMALILDLLTFTTMIIGLCFFKHIDTVNCIINKFNGLSFIRTYILISIWINILYGVILGLLRRCFFWIRH